MTAVAKLPTVDELAQEIRRVDGNHSLGAGALAEALMPFLAALSPAELGGVERTFADAEALATWLESLHEADASGAVNHRKWEPAQRAAAAIRATNLREVDSIALEVAKRFTLDTEPQRRASLQCAVIDAIVRSTPRAAEAVTEEMVERAAIAIHEHRRQRSFLLAWEQYFPDYQNKLRDEARAALTAALTPPSAKGENK